MQFSGGYVTYDDIVALLDNGMCACAFLCFKMFSVLFSNVTKISIYRVHVYKTPWGPQYLRA